MSASVFTRLRRLHDTGLLGSAVRGAVGVQISKIGQWMGSERLVYNPWTFEMFYRLAVETSPMIVGSVMRQFPDLGRVVDWGAGTGAHVARFKKLGIECVGYEYSATARQMGAERLGVDLQPFDLTDPDPWDGQRYDLAISLEVGEHLPPELGDKLVEVCVGSAPVVLFSAAAPGQGGQGHINEQPKAYWIERFEKHGYPLNETHTHALAENLRRDLFRGMHLARNVMLFEG